MTRRRALKKREQGYGPLDFAPGLSVPGIELSEPNLAPGPSPSTTRHPRQLAADAVLTQAGVDGLRCGKTACRRFVRFAAHYGLIPQDNGKVLRRRGTQMNTMQYDTSFVRVVSASLLGILIAFGLNGAVLAAGTCIEGPNLNSGQSRLGTTAWIASIIASVGTRRKQDRKHMRIRRWSPHCLQLRPRMQHCFSGSPR